MNMLRLAKISLTAVAAAVILASCDAQQEKKVGVIEGCAPSLADSKVAIQYFDGKEITLLDSISIQSDGKFSYEVPVEDGQPKVIYITKDASIYASVLAQRDVKVVVKEDESGMAQIEGSEESVLLTKVEQDYQKAINKFVNLQEDQQSEMTALYLQYRNDCIRHVVSNPHSLSSMMVLYHHFGEALPIFGQSTDALIIRDLAKGIQEAYPSTTYEEVLNEIAQKRINQMQLAQKFNDAEEVGFHDMDLPSINGKNVALSQIEEDVVLIYFTTITDPAQNYFSIQTLKPIYEDYHKKGVEIYQVCLDTDKLAWVSIILNQELPWVNVCDVRGVESPYVLYYNLNSLPAIFVMKDKEILDEEIVDAQSLRQVLDKLTR